MILVATITFGHSAEDVQAALAPFVAARESNQQIAAVVALDDCSGVRPEILVGIESRETPERMGFAAAVNYLVTDICPEATRLVLVNPDVLMDSRGAQALLDATGPAHILPVLDEHGALENLRPLLTPRRVLVGLALRERRRRDDLPRLAAVGGAALCPPLVPAGTVISLDADLIRRVPFSPEMFWIEFSDWTLRLPETITVSISPHPVDHAGASTAVNYPLSVAASQLRARYSYVMRHGGRTHRVLLRPALMIRVLRIALKKRDRALIPFLMRAAAGTADWRVSA